MARLTKQQMKQLILLGAVLFIVLPYLQGNGGSPPVNPPPNPINFTNFTWWPPVWGGGGGGGGSPPPSNNTSLASTSSLWGNSGELWGANSPLPDYSFAGYKEGAAIPHVAEVKNIKMDYGARGDGVTDDTAAFQEALDTMPQGALYVPAGTYVLSDRIVMDRSNIVLRGESKETTILKFTKSFRDLNFSNFQAWMYGQGGLLWVGETTGNTAKGGQLATVTLSAVRGSKTITLSSTSGITAGQYIIIELNPTNNSLKQYLYGAIPASKVKAAPAGVVYRWPVKVDAVTGNTVTLHQPLRTDIRTEWAPKIYSYRPVQEIGVENIRFQFPDIRYAPNGHHSEPGYNALAYWGCLNCWGENIDIFAADDAVDVSYLSKHVTLKNIRLLARSTPNPNGWHGHHGFSFNINADDNLLTDFAIDSDYHHDIDNTHFTNGNVIRNGWGRAITMGHHMDAPFENLWSNLSLGNPSWDGLPNPYGSSGGAGEAHAAQWNTYWNVKTNSGLIECPQSYRDTYWAHNYADDFASSIVFPSAAAKNDSFCIGQVGTASIAPTDLYQSQLAKRLGG